MLMVRAELNVFPPFDHSPVAPVFVRLTESVKTTPFSRIRGETTVKLPPKADEGPACNSVVAPVKVRLVDALPDWVNCRRDSVPEEKKQSVPDKSRSVPQQIEIALPTGAVIRLHDDCDPSFVAKLLIQSKA